MDDCRVVVRNSHIAILDYEMGSCTSLENNFKVWDPVTHRLIPLGMYYDKQNKILYIPRGVDIWKIKKYLGEENHRVDSPNPYKPLLDIKLKLSPRDEEQKTALRFMCGVNEFEENYYLPQLSVNLSTGKGKTYCSIATMAYLQMRSIVITYSNTLLAQWKENIKEYTNLEEKDIMFISGSPALNMILNEKGNRYKNAGIFLITHGTIQSFCSTYGWDKLNQVFINLGVGAKFIDEAHTNFENLLMIDFFTNVAKTYYVTATPMRSDFREDRIYQLSLKNVPGIDLFNESNDPHTDYIAIKWNSKPSPTDISDCKNMYGLDRNRYINYVVTRPNFWKIMTVVMDMVIKCNGRALFYIGTNDALLKVYQWILENYPEFGADVGVYTSLLDKEAKLREKNKKLLLSTTKSAGLGEHIEGLKMTVVVAEPFKSEVIARQTLGRTRDAGTLYVELVDMGFRKIRNFYYDKLPIFNKYALSTSDTMMEQYQLDRTYEMLYEDREKRLTHCPISFHDTRFFPYEEKEIPRKVVKPLIFVDKEKEDGKRDY